MDPTTILITSVSTVVLAITTGLTAWGSRLFGYSNSFSMNKALIACSAFVGTCWLASFLTNMLFDHLFRFIDQWLRIPLILIVTLGLPLFVLTVCMAVLFEIKVTHTLAISLWSVGGCVILLTAVALLSTQPITAITKVHVSEFYVWSAILTACLMMLSGYIVGTKTSTIGTNVKTDLTLDETNIRIMQSDVPTSHITRPHIEQVNDVPAIAHLLIEQGDIVKQFDIIPGCNSIGRSSQNSIVMDWDEGISRKHAVINVEDRMFELRDLGSTNSTFLNDTRVNIPRFLQNGDRIRVGSTLLTFVYNRLESQP